MYPAYQAQPFQGQNPFNPYASGGMPPAQRMYSNFPPQNFQQQRVASAPIEVYQVSSIDEAKAQIANPVAPTLFCNFGQSEIYVKHIDNNSHNNF